MYGYYGSTACVAAETYDKFAAKYRDKMWATPIFTEARVAYERRANEYQKLADNARQTCAKAGSKSSSKKKAGGEAQFQPATQEDIVAASTASSATGTRNVIVAVGGLALLGGLAVVLLRGGKK